MRSAAAEISGERLAHIFFGGARIAIEQFLGRHDHAGDAVTALRGLLSHEGLLQRVRLIDRAEALDRRDLGISKGPDRGDAGAHRRAIDRVRSEQAGSQRESRYGAASVDPASGPAGDPVADSAIAGEERRRVIACLDALTDAQRQCIELAYYGGLTYVEVAQRLAANLSTIKSRMRDALRGLRNCLDVP